MEVPLVPEGLNPSEYFGRTIKAHIAHSENKPDDCIEESEREGKSGKFKQYVLTVMIHKKRQRLNFLMGSQLAKIIGDYGTKSEEWVSKPVELTVTKKEVNDNTYFNWVITPCGEFDIEEQIKDKIEGIE